MNRSVQAHYSSHRLTNIVFISCTLYLKDRRKCERIFSSKGREKKLQRKNRTTTEKKGEEE